MIYGFVQDSAFTDITERQEKTISAYAETHDMTVDAWIYSETFSTRRFKEYDVLLLEKTFRLGNGVSSILKILQDLLRKGVVIYSCEDGIQFGGDAVSAATMAYVFGLVADITDEVRSEVTKEALRQVKSQGRSIGRPKGAKNGAYKLDKKKKEIRSLLRSGKTKAEVCRLLSIAPTSLYYYIKDHPEVTEGCNA